MMIILPVADGARLLGIHPKTLRHWLKEANVPLEAHPTDARITCVTQEHLQQVAKLHDRLLQTAVSSVLLDPTSPALVPSEGQARSLSENEVEHASIAPCLPASSMPEADLIQRLASLERKVGTMQEQLAQLTLELLRERERSVEQRLSTLEALLQQMVGLHLSAQALPETSVACQPEIISHSGRRLLPAELRARSRWPALIEYGTAGAYVLICPREGELSLVPDSPEWFDWLASLTSFRFVAPQGRFTAYRDTNHGQRTRGWRAHRYLHGRNYKYYLGTTDRLTIASLEQMATQLQSRLAAL